MKTSNDPTAYDDASPRLQARLRGHYQQAYGPDQEPEALWGRLAARLEPVQPPRTNALSRLSAWARRGLGGTLPRAVAALTLLVLASMALTLWGRPTPVSAETILQQAQSANATPLVENYHLHATMRGGKHELAMIEEWAANTGALRQELAIYDEQGELLSNEGMIENAAEVWSYRIIDGQTEVMQIPVPATKQGGKESIEGTIELADLLEAYNQKCQIAEYQGEDTIAGQAVYVIKLTPDTQSCPVVEEKAARSKPSDEQPLAWTLLWLDQQSLQTLRWRHYAQDGSTLASYEVTSIEYNVELPEGTFSYRSLEGATLVVKQDPMAK